ncbi:peptide ABC transporter, partial [Pseudomonas amygdali pv. tabaci str. ATCC 11528]|uniref:ABC transporter permease n=1 Tax=Pseudomonas amygdali TaxID=47877 RepID=UPI0001BC9D17
MLMFILRRLLSSIPTLILVSLFVFTLQKLLPGDPVLAMAGEERDPAVMEYLRDKYRLDDPIPLQYLNWVGNVLTGDLGTSLRTEQPVTTLLASKLPVTIELAVLALLIALLIGIPTGIISAVRKGTAVG